MENNNQDQYIITDDGYLISFYLNGKYHREAGPASFWKEDEDKYINLGDEHLYTVVYSTLSQEEAQDMDGMKGWSRHVALYYLNGINYDKDEFDCEIIKRNAEQLEKELNKSSIDNKLNIKNLKI